jgi:hypothetical protein
MAPANLGGHPRSSPVKTAASKAVFRNNYCGESSNHIVSIGFRKVEI